MKTFAILTDSPWAQALGWTLIHSFWQALLIFLLCQIALRTLARDATQRYLVATGGLLMMFMVSAATFFSLLSEHIGDGTIPQALDYPSISISYNIVQTQNISWLGYLYSNISLLSIFWIAGATLCSLRLIGSWWYVSRIQATAVMLDGQVGLSLNALMQRMKIQKLVKLAESSYITAPAVIGWIKPTILVPIGFLSGLSTQQIETILVHELMHIKRHDYLVNLVQSWIECILFFNPFVWMISRIVRTEREHCCDDAVITMSDAKVYVHTLAQLEARRIAATGIAVGLAENKYQLLNRIKRIMEKSVRNYSGREKLIPVVLLLTGLACASWITLQSQDKPAPAKSVAAADTTGKKKDKSLETRRVITVDERGEAHEETVEIASESEFDVPPFAAMPAPPALEVFTAMPALPAPAALPTGGVWYLNDTIPPPVAFSGHDWEAFSKAFEGKFKEQFADFYKKHQKDFDKMMKELEEKFKDGGDFDRSLHAAIAMQADQMRYQEQAVAMQEEIMALRDEQLAQEMKELELSMVEFEKEHGKHSKEIEVRAKEMELRAKEMEAMGKKMEAMGKKMEETAKAFEAELTVELVKDGYIKKNEKIRNIHWNNGEIEVNDIKIKKEHLKKYNDLHQKYFEKENVMHYVN